MRHEYLKLILSTFSGAVGDSTMLGSSLLVSRDSTQVSVVSTKYSLEVFAMFVHPLNHVETEGHL